MLVLRSLRLAVKFDCRFSDQIFSWVWVCVCVCVCVVVDDGGEHVGKREGRCDYISILIIAISQLGSSLQRAHTRVKAVKFTYNSRKPSLSAIY